MACGADIACDCPDGALWVYYFTPVGFYPTFAHALSVRFRYEMASPKAQRDELCRALAAGGVQCRTIDTAMIALCYVTTPVAFALPISRVSIHLGGRLSGLAFPWLFELCRTKDKQVCLRVGSLRGSRVLAPGAATPFDGSPLVLPHARKRAPSSRRVSLHRPTVSPIMYEPRRPVQASLPSFPVAMRPD
jgi:hypothetical protein